MGEYRYGRLREKKNGEWVCVWVLVWEGNCPFFQLWDK